MTKILRDYQIKNALECTEILNEKNIVYLQHSVRTGKTATAFQIVKNCGFECVLFLTKKKAISSIYNDFIEFEFCEQFLLTVTNYESLHNVDLNRNYDLIILDENHVNSAYPKPSIRTKSIKQKFSKLPMIMLSGTPATESSSQWYHQFWISDYSPFKRYTNFYKWAKDYVNVKQKHLGYGLINDYSDGIDEKINLVINPYIHKFTQENAGFTSKVKENILYCDIKQSTKNVIDKLKKDLIVKGSEFTITADSAVKLQSKIHQLYSGTCKFDCGNSKVIDDSKALFILEQFKNKKIAIFYYFKEELEMLKDIFKDNLTTDLTEFNSTDKNIALQQYAGAEGISLAKAEYLIYLNFGFSGSKFIQSLDRLTTLTRKENNVYFIFSKGGIESKIYNSVSKKKRYTVNQFKKDYELSI
jgi:hypothetical protein